MDLTSRDRVPFMGAVPETVLADREQARLFGTIGGTRGLIRGTSAWPDLDALVRDRSAALLEERGDGAWREAGGVLGSDGRPTLEARSSLGLAIVTEIAEG